MNFSSEVPYSSLEKAFKANQSADIVSLGKEMMVINILSNEGVYSSQQATLVLKNFFSKHPGNSFEYTFKGKQTSDGAFAIANYFSKSEKYRVTIHFKKINASYKIESLSIEKD